MCLDGAPAVPAQDATRVNADMLLGAVGNWRRSSDWGTFLFFCASRRGHAGRIDRPWRNADGLTSRDILVLLP